MTLQEAGDSATAYLESRTGNDLPDRVWRKGSDRIMDTCGGTNNFPDRGCAGLAWPDRVLLSWTVKFDVNTYRPEFACQQMFDGMYVIFHEAAHSGGRVGGDLEEGLTDAVALDLYPGWLRTLGARCRVKGPMRYPRQVSLVRKLSAKATGTKWTSAASARWRVQLWASDDATRFATIQGM